MESFDYGCHVVYLFLSKQLYGVWNTGKLFGPRHSIKCVIRSTCKILSHKTNIIVNKNIIVLQITAEQFARLSIDLEIIAPEVNADDLEMQEDLSEDVAGEE